jgi:Na+/H+ antiporter NhaD/arsenite permease-like protein
LVSFAFSQFILVEALSVQGWIDIFANWLRSATNEDVLWTFWIMFCMSDVLIRISGTNIEGTMLLIKVVRVANLPDDSNRAAHVALGIASSAWAIRQVFHARCGRRGREVLVDEDSELRVDYAGQ